MLGYGYAPGGTKKSYRGMVTMWKFDRARDGSTSPSRSRSELPPYWQDLSDAGKLASDGWFFVNSFNSEMATGGIEKGNPPFEAGAQQTRHGLPPHRELEEGGDLQGQEGQADQQVPVISLGTSIAENICISRFEPKPRTAWT